uniref:Uncharacterized protein n=1 Tax=Pipistrellus kuhlii TaxID=59472 RepID=A0A7J7XBP6_PIPKU|nr:hypothetical protein mPipKuh1_010599 [Pipistrellus kuhlii]
MVLTLRWHLTGDGREPNVYSLLKELHCWESHSMRNVAPSSTAFTLTFTIDPVGTTGQSHLHLLADVVHTVGFIQRLHLKAGAFATATGPAGPRHLQDRMAIGILNGELGEEGMPGLQRMVNGGA